MKRAGGWALILLFVPLFGAAPGEVRLTSGRVLPTWSLKSNGIAVVMAPELGGKILSIKGPGGGEILSRSPRPYAPRVPGMKYVDSEFDGWDEIFPSLQPCAAGKDHPAIPDHGETWTLPWRMTAPDTFEVAGSILPYALSRRISTTPSTLIFSYRLRHTGSKAFPWVYLSHPLFNVTGGFDLDIPGSCPMTLKGSSRQFLGTKGSQATWGSLKTGPLGGKAYSNGRGHYWNLATESLTTGTMALFPGDAAPFTFSWDAGALPAVAFWSTEGAILGGLEHFAVEPTTSPENSLAAAVENGTARTLTPGQVHEWSIRIRFAPPPRQTPEGVIPL